jgi:hypothetical protein
MNAAQSEAIKAFERLLKQSLKTYYSQALSRAIKRGIAKKKLKLQKLK